MMVLNNQIKNITSGSIASYRSNKNLYSFNPCDPTPVPVKLIQDLSALTLKFYNLLCKIFSKLRFTFYLVNFGLLIK